MKRTRLIGLVIGGVVVAAGLVGLGYVLASGPDTPSSAVPAPAAAAPGAGGQELRALLDKGRVETYHAKYKASSTDPAAAGQLTALVTDRSQDVDVRIAASAALLYHRTLAVARALIPRLGERDFGVAWQARRSL